MVRDYFGSFYTQTKSFLYKKKFLGQRVVCENSFLVKKSGLAWSCWVWSGLVWSETCLFLSLQLEVN